MQFIQENSSLQVPQVFIYNTDINNAAEAAFMPIKMLPGIFTINALGSHKVHSSVIPIEAIIQKEDSRYKTGPIPGISSPFNTAAAFFKA
ncbi:hypothetical protein CT0861_02046 [Colletotrichum tofieldiae]|uniref:Uncharacterized protein n=1 Tax=Colletotrichum tofieldiae TaxID=708197 RepID=A0A166LW43_9PEZI|nr:hypothetical protein CT0861_02046 [Colletotrichum tofieldiae]